MMLKRLETKLGIKVSIGLISVCKPFFCVTPTEREMSLCLCKLCLNVRQLFEALTNFCKKEGLDYPSSLSGHFMDGCKCDKEANGFFPLSCVKEKCKTGDGKIPVMNCNGDTVTEVTYYQYETVTVEYIAKRGKEKGQTKTSVRTERVIYSQTVEDVTTKMNSMRSKYMLHKYLIADDNYHWKTILSTVSAKEPIYHMDFSENLQFNLRSKRPKLLILLKGSTPCTAQYSMTMSRTSISIMSPMNFGMMWHSFVLWWNI